VSPDPSNVRGVQLLQDVLARAVEDEEYREQLLSDPRGVLGDAGLEVPEDIEIVVHQNSDDRVHVVLPSRPQSWDELDPDVVDIALIMECPL
jgi:hypothetical protein